MLTIGRIQITLIMNTVIGNTNFKERNKPNNMKNNKSKNKTAKATKSTNQTVNVDKPAKVKSKAGRKRIILEKEFSFCVRNGLLVLRTAGKPKTGEIVVTKTLPYNFDRSSWVPIPYVDPTAKVEATNTETTVAA